MHIDNLCISIMGQDFSKLEIGPRSSRVEVIKDVNTEIDYKNTNNTSAAKKELYELFMDDKIVHISKLEEAEDKLEQEQKNHSYIRQEFNNYKLNQSKMLDNKGHKFKVEKKINTTNSSKQ